MELNQTKGFLSKFCITKLLAKHTFTMKLKIMLISSIALLAAVVSGHAQEGRPEGGPRGMRNMDPKEFATQRADQVNRLVSGLTDKQYKKIYNLYYGEIQARLNQMSNFGGGPGGGFGGPGGGMGRGEGMGGPGGGDFGGGQGMRGGGQGMRPGGGEGGFRDGPGMRGNSEERAKQEAALDKKLQKILTPEQFEQWQNRPKEQFRGPRAQ